MPNNRRPKPSCGTPAALGWHRRNGVELDRECREERRRQGALYRERVRAMATRSGDGPLPAHGTIERYWVHLKKETPVCDKCRLARECYQPLDEATRLAAANVDLFLTLLKQEGDRERALHMLRERLAG